MKTLIDKIISSESVYMIAEIGINHNGDMQLAKEMIDAAVENGASCVKFQSFVAEKYISVNACRANYQNQKYIGDKTQYEIIRECEVNIKQMLDLQDYSNTKGVDFLTTPFETHSLDSLEELDLPAIKISSCNLTNSPFLKKVSSTNKPVMLSTGMGNLCEVINAVEIFNKNNNQLLLFQCTSNYPSKIKNANLKVLQTYQNLFNVPVGLSDHTSTHTTAIAAVALGAIAIEKHFTLSHGLPGIDQKASMLPHQLKELVEMLGECKASLGSQMKFKTDEEEDTSRALRRSLVASIDLLKGSVLENNMVEIKRPGTGLPVDFLPYLLGRELKRDIDKDKLFLIDDFV